jgi:hypothetical protein
MLGQRVPSRLRPAVGLDEFVQVVDPVFVLEFRQNLAGNLEDLAGVGDGRARVLSAFLTTPEMLEDRLFVLAQLLNQLRGKGRRGAKAETVAGFPQFYVSALNFG